MNNGLAMLAILMKHSDKDHTLKQRDIQQLLKEEYGFRVDRETIRRNISDMIELGLPVGYTNFNRAGSEDVITDIYFNELKRIRFQGYYKELVK